MTEKAGLQGTGYGMGVAAGDYDNDGYEDLYVTAYGGNKLYHNNGDGTFTDVTAAAGVGGNGWSTSAAWVDLDGDGLLDLVVLRYLQWDFEDIYCGEHKEGYRSYCHPELSLGLRRWCTTTMATATSAKWRKRSEWGKPARGLDWRWRITITTGKWICSWLMIR